MSEKKYQHLKFRMLDWPFCVGLIIGSPSVASRIRGTTAQHELFLSAKAELKPLLISRKEARLELTADGSDVRPKVILDRLLQKSAEGNILPLSNESTVDAISEISSSALDQQSLSFWVALFLEHIAMIDLDLIPRTLEQEPLIPAPKAAIECQRFGQRTFNRIRYAEVQKKLPYSVPYQLINKLNVLRLLRPETFLRRLICILG
nr:unnamed protein product [Callosobruchus analis]